MTTATARSHPNQKIQNQAFHETTGNNIHYERHQPEQTTLYELIQEHTEIFFAQVETDTGVGLPKFVKDEFDAFLGCGILTYGFLRLRCTDCN